ncbi:MAG TPA: response regulator [Tardiphaga sp.]
MQDKQKMAAAAVGGAAAKQALHLLVIDDDATQRKLVSLAAAKAGHAVTFAISCADAIAKLRERQFDCVTLDLALGDGDGLEVLKAMNATGQTVPVIVISGMDRVRREESRFMARALGIEMKSLPKPVDLAALRVLLANLRYQSLGLPMIHMWGGVAVSNLADDHRN